jgi:hypothetical protein
MQDIKDIINHLKEQAKKSMRKNGGELEPKMYFLILYPGQKTPVYFPVPCSKFFESAKMKSKMPIYSALAWEKKKRESQAGIDLIAVCLISDTWQASLNVDGKSEAEINEILENAPQASKMPNRREALVLGVCFKDKSELYLLYYKRKGKNIEFQETINEAEFVGTMSELYPTGDYSGLLDVALNYAPDLYN